MKKLAILINSMNGGGAEHVVSILLVELIKTYEVYLVVLQSGIAYEIPDQVKSYLLGDASIQTNDYKKMISLPILGYKYHRFCKKNQIDISLSLLNRSNYINIFSKFFGAKHRTIISERASTVEVYPSATLKDRLSRFLVRWLYPHAEAIIAISKGVGIDLDKIFNIDSKKIKPIYNPIDLNYLDIKLDSSLPDEVPIFTFIAIGRMYPQKNFKVLLEAFAMLNNLSTKLIILGEGPLRMDLEKQINCLGIEGRVSMPGFVKNIFPYLKQSNCFVISSDFEGFGNVIIEAMACGKPVIATDCKHGPSEILDDKVSPVISEVSPLKFAKYGLLVAKNNPKALAQAMHEMMINKEKRKSYELIGSLRANDFNKKSIAKQYVDVLEGNPLN